MHGKGYKIDPLAWGLDPNDPAFQGRTIWDPMEEFKEPNESLQAKAEKAYDIVVGVPAIQKGTPRARIAEKLGPMVHTVALGVLRNAWADCLKKDGVTDLNQTMIELTLFKKGSNDMCPLYDKPRFRISPDEIGEMLKPFLTRNYLEVLREYQQLLEERHARTHPSAA